MNNPDYGVKPFTQTTEERYFYMLEVLPPCKWYRGDYVQFFHVSERLSGDIVAWYAMVRGATPSYWEMQDVSTLPKDELIRKLMAAIPTATA